MSPTFISDIYIGITATLPPLLPPKRNLHRNLHRQNCINLQRSQTNCKLITFPKLSQKREEGGRSKKQVYTLLNTEINGENGGDNIVEYQQLKRFIMQVEAFSLCKLRQFHCAS